MISQNSLSIESFKSCYECSNYYANWCVIFKKMLILTANSTRKEETNEIIKKSFWKKVNIKYFYYKIKKAATKMYVGVKILTSLLQYL